MANNKPSLIPNSLRNASNKFPYVAESVDIYDNNSGKSQEDVNIELGNQISATQKQDVIPVDTLPSVSEADPKKIYRVVGETSYIDYMVNAEGTGWKELGEFSFPGIDDEPTAGSNNLVKSGGVKQYADNTFVKNQNIVYYGDSTERDADNGDQNVGILVNSWGILNSILVNVANQGIVTLRIYNKTNGVVVYEEEFTCDEGVNNLTISDDVEVDEGYIISLEGEIKYNSTLLDQIFYTRSSNVWVLRSDLARFQFQATVDSSLTTKVNGEFEKVNESINTLDNLVIPKVYHYGDLTERTSSTNGQYIGILAENEGKIRSVYVSVGASGNFALEVWDAVNGKIVYSKVFELDEGDNTIVMPEPIYVKPGYIVAFNGDGDYNGKLKYNSALTALFYFYINNVWVKRTDYIFRFQYEITVDELTDDEKYNNLVVNVGSTREYKKLTDALRFAMQKENSVIILDSEEFDIINELGNDYMSKEFTGTENNRGIELFNNITIKGTGNSVIKAHYLGDNATANEYFSLFNTKGSFTLENLTLDCKNIRYCIHDEQGNRTKPYKTQYLGCSMKIDNSKNADFPAMQCIGGGLGSHGTIVIKDCIFDAVLTTTYFRDTIGCVSYHNNIGQDNTSKSNLVVTGNYFKASTFALMWHGVSTLVSECLLSNNSFETEVIERGSSASQTIVNTKILGWNNIVRGVNNR